MTTSTTKTSLIGRDMGPVLTADLDEGEQLRRFPDAVWPIMLRVMPAICLFTAVIALSPTVAAAEVGHYVAGLLNIRDFAQPPEPGFYGALYQTYYTTERLNDRDGNRIRSLDLDSGPGPGINVPINVSVDIYGLAPILMYVTEWNVLGARFGALIVPNFANASLNAELGNQSALGAGADNDNFGLGDLVVQPLWLDWAHPHFDIAVAYAFYAPTGQYDTAPRTLPTGAVVRVESPDNIGYGFWTNQFQAAGLWYPWQDKRTAVMIAATYEVNSDKEDYDVTPGDVLSLNWGISQYLPLKRDNTWLAEVGIAGYDSWQVTHDTGRDASNELHDNVHAVGFQVGLTQVPWGAVLNLHYDYEFASENRFQGHVVGLSLAKKLTH